MKQFLFIITASIALSACVTNNNSWQQVEYPSNYRSSANYADQDFDHLIGGYR